MLFTALSLSVNKFNSFQRQKVHEERKGVKGRAQGTGVGLEGHLSQIKVSVFLSRARAYPVVWILGSQLCEEAIVTPISVAYLQKLPEVLYLVTTDF